MAYDSKLADCIRRALGPRPDVTEKEMFGGLAFLRDGKMFCGVVRDDLMVRVGPERYGAALERAGARPMDFTGRPMVGYVFVAPVSSARPAALRRWLEEALEFVGTLPSRPRRAPRRAPPKGAARRPARR